MKFLQTKLCLIANTIIWRNFILLLGSRADRRMTRAERFWEQEYI
jgi:hypothetical protein